MMNRGQIVGGVTLLFVVALLLYNFHPSSSAIPFTSHHTSPSYDSFPRRIWQTWKASAQGLDDELRGMAKTWIDKNPGYRYELLTDESAKTYVQDRFQDRPDIVKTFKRTKDTILRADLIRYLSLLGDGGIYTDIDTDCSRPIDQWVPAEYANATGLVVGVEYDAREEEVRLDMTLRVQFCQWTIMAKPGNKVMQHVVDRVIKALQELGREEDGREKDSITAEMNGGDVMEITGPRIFTKAIFESLSEQTGRKVTDVDVSMLDNPKLIGDVLILPVSAFASGQGHSGSKDWGNDQQLISHHWQGFQTWKPEHEEQREESSWPVNKRVASP